MRSPRPIYFPALDGLRAFSILFVIFHHAAHRPAWMTHFDGWLGVDIFFVLSGFLITYLLEKESRDTGKIDLKAFYIRRAFRILPVYAFVLGLYVALARFSGHHDKWLQLKHSLPYFLTFCNELVPNVVDHATAFGYSWTLGVEEKFYILWPVLFFIVLAAKKSRPYLIAALYLGLVALSPFAMEAARSYSGLMVGCFLAFGLTHPATAALRERIARLPVLLPLVLVAFAFYLVDRNKALVFFFSWTVLFLLAHLLLASSWLRTFLSHPILGWFGKRSYGMYLVHHLWLDVIQSRIHAHSAAGIMLVVVGTFGFSALAADLMLRWIESPARNYGKRLIARKAQAPASTAPEPALAQA